MLFGIPVLLPRPLPRPVPDHFPRPVPVPALSSAAALGARARKPTRSESRNSYEHAETENEKLVPANLQTCKPLRRRLLLRSRPAGLQRRAALARARYVARAPFPRVHIPTPASARIRRSQPFILNRRTPMGNPLSTASSREDPAGLTGVSRKGVADTPNSTRRE